jgi:hypothetical protein
VDLYKAIRELVEEKKRIDRIIASLEAMLARGRVGPHGKAATADPPKRRGRKSMSPEERREVSERMARYWAEKRAGKAGQDGAGEDAPSNHPRHPDATRNAGR